MATKRELFIFKAQHDTALLKEVVLERPHQHALGSKERGSSWDKISKNLVNEGMKVTKRSVRKRFTKLYEDFLDKEKKEKGDSGVDVEYNENQQLLTDYHELILDWEKEREEKVDDEKAVAEEMRRKATERLSVKKKRKVEEADSDKDEAGLSRRKSRRSLVEIMEQSITNRREEKKRDMEIKENELKQQEQFHGLLLQQQQQMQQMHLQQQQQQQAMNMAMMSTLSEMLKTVRNMASQ